MIILFLGSYYWNHDDDILNGKISAKGGFQTHLNRIN
jgi:hypothetical protein